MKTIWYQQVLSLLMLTLITWLSMSVRFPSVNLLSPSLPILYPLEGGHRVQPRLKQWGIFSTSLSMSIHINYFKSFIWEICMFSLIYSFTYSFMDLLKHLLCQYKLMDIYVILWVLILNTTLFFSLKLFQG